MHNCYTLLSLIALVLMVLIHDLSAQNYTISGRVTNQQGEALDLASVFIPRSSIGTVTDTEGMFTLEGVPEGEQIIKITFVGYRSWQDTFDVFSDFNLDIELLGSIFNIDEIEISANRVTDQNVFTYQTIDKENIALRNLGQDIPILLNSTVGSVATSDAGAGIGYTGLRIRGVDGTGINVTINGVPWNDSESHGVFFVNLPNLSSLASSVQIQRGVGTSANGAGAFGSTISIETHDFNLNPHIKADVSFGSFGTIKYAFDASTGLMNNKYVVNASFSNISSDGYVDRASSDLTSYHFEGSRITDRRITRLIFFNGAERTYQSWFGVPQSLLEEDEEALQDHYTRNIGTLYLNAQDSTNLFNSDRRYNYYQYPNQVDDYTQSHFQLHDTYKVNSNWTLDGTLFYTLGSGFFEEYKYQETLDFYGLENVKDRNDSLITVGNVIRRRWLDNDYYGLLAHARYENDQSLQLDVGGGISNYVGDHFGEVADVEESERFFESPRYYEGIGKKLDANAYLKSSLPLYKNVRAFADLQYRIINYRIDGQDNDLQVFNIDEQYGFFNPKAGINWSVDKENTLYASWARAHREPVRRDFTDNPANNLPLPERLDNLEAGYRYRSGALDFDANFYHMKYVDQLVITGALNDVGATLRQNVADSYRQGIELSAQFRPSQKLLFGGNIAFNRTNIDEFTEVLYDYTNGFEIIENTFENVSIAFSPEVTGNFEIAYLPINGLDIRWIGKYVGEQYLDNTENPDRQMDAFNVHDLQIGYQLNIKGFKEARVRLLVNNLLNTKYVANGYTYSYVLNDLITENFFYPQATRNFLAGVTVKF